MPIKENNGKNYNGKSYWNKDEDTGKAYYGRGFVQLTHKVNYSKFSRLLGRDLVNNPDIALDPEIAALILVIGMRDGIFTGKKLS